MNEITFEETPPAAPTHTISEAWGNLWRDPAQFIKYWNYKGAILSGVLRAPIFLVTYLVGRESIRLAVGAALVQFLFRFLFAGVSGAMIQSFRKVEPAWKALLTILLIVPLISHIFEFVLQASFAYFTATQDHTDEAILRSITVSIISALFTLFAMRRNIMTVGDEDSKSLLSDLSKLPKLIFEFIAFVPNEISFMLRKHEFLSAAIGIAGFGVFAQLMCWAVTNKMSWTYGSGRELPFVKFWGIDGIILLLIAIGISSVVYRRAQLQK
ncbi:MAG: hypothetical protein ACT4O9_10635 [Blastocatellia bacterium]